MSKISEQTFEQASKQASKQLSKQASKQKTIWDQSEVTKRIKLGDAYMPPYPTMWSFCAMNPVIDSQQFESLTQFQIKDKEILREIKRLVKPLAQDNYDIDYFCVKQKVFKEIQIASLSFHTWYFSKLSNGSNDMSNANFQDKIIVGAVSINDHIGEPTEKSFGGRPNNKLVLNGFGERGVYIRRQLKSPKNENSFRIITNSEPIDIKLVSIAYVPHLKKAVVTLHIFHQY